MKETRRYRYEYRQKKKAKEEAKAARERHAERTGRKAKKSAFREFIGWVLYILIIIGVTYLLVTYVGQRTKVSGSSMEPTLHNGDNLIVDKITYRFRDPERFEVVVFPYKYQEDTYYIKRIIGMPGETIQIIEGYIYINGEKLEESFGLEVIETGKYGIAADPIALGENEYFVMGDNRNHSADSRESSVGVLHGDDFIGRAWVRIWPFNSFGVVPHE